MKQKGKKKPLAALCALSLFVAISIVMGKYLAIGVGQVLRFSFENMPIMLAGILFGPIAGVLVGVVADLVGCMLVGYTVNPFVMLGAALVGLISGAFWRISVRLDTLSFKVSTFLTVFLSHLVGSVAVKTVGLSAWYDMPLLELFIWRLINYLLVGCVEALLLYVLLSNRSFRSAAWTVLGEDPIKKGEKK